MINLTLLRILNITFILLLTVSNKVQAFSTVFVEDFENYDENTLSNNWTVVRNLQYDNFNLKCMNGNELAKWTIAEDEDGNKKAGITIKGKSCVIELKAQKFTIPDPSNYQLEMDMTFGQNIYTHRNIAYKYQDDARWYGIKFYHSNRVDFQKANPGATRNPGSTIYPESFEPGKKYRMRILTQNNHVTFYVNESVIFEYNDYFPILNEGSIALQASAGPWEESMTNATYFDNIVVTDLSDSVLNINHLSQKDPAWSDETYDHAPTWAKPESIGIKNWGCALTSASMVLNYHGFQNDPKTLNQYLIEQNGYNTWGGVIWSYFTKFARQAKDINPELINTKLLEFSYPEFDMNTLNQDLVTKQPSIIKLLINPEAESHHFLVAGGKNSQTQDILVFDPGQLLTTPISIEQTYSGKEKLRLARFTPSNTDLSFLWIYGQNTLGELGITDNLGQILPESQNFHEGGIQDNESTDTGPTYKTYFLAKPSDGNYHVTFTGDKPGIHTIEIAAFDSVANDQHQVFRLFSNPTIRREIVVSYDKTNAQNTQFKPITSFEIIRALIEYGHAQSEITSWGDKHFIHMINQIEKLILRQNMRAATSIRNATIHQVYTAFIENQISQELRDSLIYELQLLNFENSQ